MFDLNSLFNTAAQSSQFMNPSGFGQDNTFQGGLADQSGAFGSNGLQGIFGSNFSGLSGLLNPAADDPSKGLDVNAFNAAAKMAQGPGNTTQRLGGGGLGSHPSAGQIQDLSGAYTGKNFARTPVRPGLSNLIYGK